MKMPLFINQTQLQQILSLTGKKIHNYELNAMIENKELPEPTVRIGKSKRWSIEVISEKLQLSQETIHSFLKH